MMASPSRYSVLLRILLLLGLVAVTLASANSDVPPTYLRHQRRALERPHLLRRTNDSSLTNVSSTAITEAQRLVTAAAAQQGEYNAYRVANPRRNQYYASNSSEAQAYRKRKRDTEPVPPTLNATVRAAAALLASHTAAQKEANGTLHKIYPQPQNLPRNDDYAPGNNTKRSTTSDYWVSTIKHDGLAPMGANSDWLVYRDVTDTMFAGGAKGDGVTDDTAAINAAIKYGGNCGLNCLSSSIEPTFIFFPPGTYLISTPIEAYYYSQLVGDALDMPVIKTSENFIGLGAIETDVYTADGEWYINQSNFYRQVRNFQIDISDTTTAAVAGLHWQVAQATSLFNCRIFASTDPDTTQLGMFTENGSSGFMGDCFFSGGAYGIDGGNQQYTVRGFDFSSQTKAAILLLWDWGWTWSQISIVNTPVGFYLVNPADATGQQAGSIYVMDTIFENVPTAVFAEQQPATILESSVMTFDNIGVLNVDTMVAFADGSSLELPNTDLDFAIVGNFEAGGAAYGAYTINVNRPDPSLTTSASGTYARDGYYFRSRPQYEGLIPSEIRNVKDEGAKGDGVTDDWAALSAIFASVTTELIYFPAGTYLVSDTLVAQPGTLITGQVWSQIAAFGDKFADAANPRVMFQVGAVGDVGSFEISDMMFTSIGALPGLIMVEWNMAASSQGSVALWDTHFRVGGAIGTKLQVADCPKGAAIQEGCIAAAMMMHVTESASGYFENMWAWIADHDLDDAENTMITIAVGRGILVESTGPTWWLGTASEHAMLYQYNFYGAQNVWAGMIQTESPYFQATTITESPGPFSATIGQFNNDPVFPDSSCTAGDLYCNFSWAVMIAETTGVTISGAGLYSWFDNYDQSACVDAQNCQQRLVDNQGGNEGLYIWNLVTIGAVEMLSDTSTGDVIYAANNTQAIAHPFWSILGAYLDDYAVVDTTCDDDDTSAECYVAPTCDFNLSFDTLDALSAASGSFPNICTDYYALSVLGTMLDGALTEYASANDGYDTVFGYYVEYTKDMVPSALTECMASSPLGGCLQFFSCHFIETAGGGSDQITYNPCPVPDNQISYVDEYSMTYTLEDADGFWNYLATTYGIQKSWVDFQTVRHFIPCTGSNNGGGNGKNLDKKDLEKRCDTIDIYSYGMPVSSGNIVVTNPKDIITAALPTIGVLQNTIMARRMDLVTYQWSGPTDDLLQVISMPVFLIVQAVAAMESAKDTAEAQKKKDKTALILEILGIVFAFIPFIDEFTPELEALDGVFEIVAAAGNVALGIQSIIADPSSAPMDILGILTAGGFKDETDFASMAATRRGIDSDDLTKIGADFKKADDDFQAVIKMKSCKL